MASARYWRLVAIAAFGDGDLSLAQAHLYSAGSRVGAALTPSCSHAPVSGALADLSDASAATGCTWARADVAASGFALQWDFGGAPADVDEVRLLPLVGDVAPQVFDVYYQAGSGQWLLSPASRGGGSDPLWGNVVALLRFDGADGSTAVVDESPDALSFTCQGGAKLSATGPKFGSAALALSPSTSDYVVGTTVPTTLNFGAGDFSIEVWCYPTSSGRVTIVASTFGGVPIQGFILALLTDNRPYASIGNAGAEFAACAGASPLASGVWSKLEYTRSGANFYLFVNGTLVASAMDSRAVGTLTVPLHIGQDPSQPNRLFAGKIDSLRITKGAARHTASHTVDGVDYPGAGSVLIRSTLQRDAVAFSAPVSPFSSVSNRSVLARDKEFGGRARIVGDVGIKGASGAPDTMTKSRVRLLRARDGLLARETWSDAATGAFEFTGLDERTEFIALAQDSTGSFRPVAADRVLPEVPA